jgi:ribosome biogenesis GTPase A
MGYWGVVNNCLKNADIILLIVDARIPQESTNKEIIRIAGQLEKRILLVFNKIDLVDFSKLKRDYPGSIFVSAEKNKGIKELRTELERISEIYPASMRVAILGYPNVGKSSILNKIVPQSREKVSRVSGTTKKTKWIRYKNLRFMDSPGVIPRRDSKVAVGLTASKNIHKIKNPEKVAIEVIKVLRRNSRKKLEEHFKITFDEEEDNYDILLKIGEKRKYLIKGGEIDENKTAIKIVEEWQKGKI